MSGWVRVAAAGDIPDERTLRVEIGGTPVCLARSDGELFAVNDTCTHADVSLSEGEVEDGKVECWLHGSQFDLRTGEPTCLPAITPVATYAVMTTDGEVFVDLARRPDHHTDNSVNSTDKKHEAHASAREI
jgi:3-phenylpropionate/trans-cinnamate dioxygenase ferredoxin component